MQHSVIESLGALLHSTSLLDDRFLFIVCDAVGSSHAGETQPSTKEIETRNVSKFMYTVLHDM